MNAKLSAQLREVESRLLRKQLLWFNSQYQKPIMNCAQIIVNQDRVSSYSARIYEERKKRRGKLLESRLNLFVHDCALSDHQWESSNTLSNCLCCAGFASWHEFSGVFFNGKSSEKMKWFQRECILIMFISVCMKNYAERSLTVTLKYVDVGYYAYWRLQQVQCD